MPSPLWPASLQQPPRITRMGLSVHHKRESARHVYRIRGRWLIHFYGWSGSIEVNKVRLAIQPGFVGICPPNAQLVFRYNQRAFHSFAEFELPGDAGQAQRLPAMQNLGTQFEGLHERFQTAIGWHLHQPARANARLWDVLWVLASSEAQTTQEQAGHPYILWAQQHVEAHLSSDLRAITIAKQLGCSADYLSRLFQRHLGTNLSAFVQSRRMRQAQELLIHTSLPINAVGAEVGLADPHVFNKFVRRLTGLSPKQLRQGLPPSETRPGSHVV